ncbi:hypothetical protein CSHISOI_11716 [Colletotrichum shisoi]|uniref:Uncharacterized protein n=1 Tax=Colletotrichum shisoi TaxID=2078593 RepID=A0A5Q4BAC8_9PEZI|nr:hypothetical protein CSHISOI_11716 [Colletotrichum shisoi]
MNADPGSWRLINPYTPVNEYYGVDCGQWDYWRRNEPAECRNDGLRKGRGVFHLNRAPRSIRDTFAVSFENGDENDLSREGAGVKVHVEVTIKPEYIVRFHEGTLDPRMGLFMDARVYEPSVPKGDVPKLIRFADLLNKSPPSLLGKAQDLNPSALPHPSEEIEQIKNDLIEHGYGLEKNALLPEEVDIIKNAVL